MQFSRHIKEKLDEVTDEETYVDNLFIKEVWKDNGGNVHATIRGRVSRRDQSGECGGEVVWLKRLKIFRGNFWSRLNPKTDYEYYEEARKLFYSGKYVEFISVSGFIYEKYQNNPPFKKMRAIAKART